MGDIQFDLMAFVNNLKYMGLGMLGVFIIVGIIIFATHFTSFTIKKIEEQKEANKGNK
jgi:hypothetical protein